MGSRDRFPPPGYLSPDHSADGTLVFYRMSGVQLEDEWWKVSGEEEGGEEEGGEEGGAQDPPGTATIPHFSCEQCLELEKKREEEEGGEVSSPWVLVDGPTWALGGPPMWVIPEVHGFTRHVLGSYDPMLAGRWPFVSFTEAFWQVRRWVLSGRNAAPYYPLPGPSHSAAPLVQCWIPAHQPSHSPDGPNFWRAGEASGAWDAEARKHVGLQAIRQARYLGSPGRFHEVVILRNRLRVGAVTWGSIPWSDFPSWVVEYSLENPIGGCITHQEWERAVKRWILEQLTSPGTATRVF
jgi:hypothetical protein